MSRQGELWPENYYKAEWLQEGSQPRRVVARQYTPEGKPTSGYVELPPGKSAPEGVPFEVWLEAQAMNDEDDKLPF